MKNRARLIILGGIISLMYCCVTDVSAQKGIMLPTITDDNGEVFPYMHLRTIYCFKNKGFKRKMDLKKLERLVRNLKIVYPYAKAAQRILNETEREIALLTDPKEISSLVKEKEKELKKKYSTAIMNMTISQGKLLIKLIDRETGKSSYEIIKQIRNGFEAFIWQGIAKMFGTDLKDEYDPENDDAVIEKLVILLEQGML